MHLFEFIKNIPKTNLVTLQDSSTQADLHQQFTGLNASALDSAKSSNWLDIRDVNAIVFEFVYVYGAGTSLSFDIEVSPDGCNSNGTQNSSATRFALPAVSVSAPSSNVVTVTGNTQTTFTVTTGASKNFCLALDRLNYSYIRLYNITAAGSPTTSDKITVIARAKRFVG